MEHWSIGGKRDCFSKPIIPLLHHSNTPVICFPTLQYSNTPFFHACALEQPLVLLLDAPVHDNL